jgi:GAF domain-containing protein
MTAAAPENEKARLEALRRYQILDTPAEKCFDDLATLAARSFRVPAALITFVDSDRVWFKAKVGIDLPELPRAAAYCSHSILRNDTFIITDISQDDAFLKNTLAQPPFNFRFYAGVPLRSSDNLAVGTLCIFDVDPRNLNAEKTELLQILSSWASTLLELRRTKSHLEEFQKQASTDPEELRETLL